MREFLLFTYGTIGDPEFFEGLLKRKAAYQTAQLSGYQCLLNPDTGYLFVKPAIGKQVFGKLVAVTEQELAILDLWEEVPMYRRELQTVECKTGRKQAFVYTQNHANGVPLNSIHKLDRASVLLEIQTFRNWFDNSLTD